MKKNKGMIVAFSLPLTLALIIMYLYPVARTVLMSFFKIESVTSSMSAWSFYGVGNYAKIFGSPTFQGSMKNMGLIWLIGGIISGFTIICLRIGLGQINMNPQLILIILGILLILAVLLPNISSRLNIKKKA